MQGHMDVCVRENAPAEGEREEQAISLLRGLTVYLLLHKVLHNNRTRSSMCLLRLAGALRG